MLFHLVQIVVMYTQRLVLMFVFIVPNNYITKFWYIEWEFAKLISLVGELITEVPN